MTFNLRFGSCLRGEAKARIMSRTIFLFGEGLNLGFGSELVFGFTWKQSFTISFTPEELIHSINTVVS